jgi:hypothetical protein
MDLGGSFAGACLSGARFVGAWARRADFTDRDETKRQG